MGLSFEAQKAIKVYYDNQMVGEYFADVLIESQVIVELKASKNLA